MYVSILLNLGFNLNFSNDGMDVYLGTTYYGFDYVSNNFIILDVDDSTYVNYREGCFSLSASLNNVDVDVNVCYAKIDYIR